MHLPCISDWPRIGPGAGTVFKKPRKHANLQGLEQGLQHPDHRFKSGCRLEMGPSKDGPVFIAKTQYLCGLRDFGSILRELSAVPFFVIQSRFVPINRFEIGPRLALD